MPRFLLTRVASGLGVLLLVCLFTYLVFFALSPDPAVQICGKNCTPELIDQIRGNLGLDQPFWTQFFHFVVGIFAGRTYGEGVGAVDCAMPCLGYSFQSSQAVWDMIVQRLPVSATVAVGAAVLWLLAGLAGGLLSAVKEGTFFDRFVTGLTLTSMSIPNYVLALVLQYVLVVKLQWLPFPQAVPFADDPVQWFLNFVMPWMVLAIGYAAAYTRLTRANVLDVLRENYVRTAFAKGLHKRRVIFVHALRNSLIPIATGLGHVFSLILAGSFLIERVFNIDGMGYLGYNAILQRDYPVALGILVISSLLMLIGNILSDVIYAVVDPRIRF